jgi:hypothetical protein
MFHGLLLLEDTPFLGLSPQLSPVPCSAMTGTYSCPRAVSSAVTCSMLCSRQPYIPSPRSLLNCHQSHTYILIFQGWLLIATCEMLCYRQVPLVPERSPQLSSVSCSATDRYSPCPRPVSSAATRRAHALPRTGVTLLFQGCLISCSLCHPQLWSDIL